MGLIRIAPIAEGGGDPYRNHTDLAQVLYGPDASSLVRIGSMMREGGQWKRAYGFLERADRFEETSGVAGMIAAVRNGVDPDADLEVALAIHDGYVCIYNADGSMAARVLEIPDGQRIRIMDPHAAETVAGGPAEAVGRAFAMLRALRA